jgi:ribosomal protein S12 methylthiotransferase accessory factor
MAFKTYRHGTHRTVSPDETLARVRPLMPAMGITRLADLTGLDRIGVPVFAAYRPNSRSVATSLGKGLTRSAAMASALMEAVEGWHAERVELPLRWASCEELRTRHRLVDVDALPQPRGSLMRPHRPLLWIEGRDLLTEAPVWLPYELVHADFTLPQPAGAGCFRPCTNGLASGNDEVEALCHALAEVIERDANALWNRLEARGRDRTAIDLASVDDPGCREVLDRIEAAGLCVGVWETTSDLEVPSYFCLLLDRRVPDAHPGSGSGAHPAPEIALLRALTEAVQVRVTYIAGARDDLRRHEYAAGHVADRWHDVGRLLGRAVPQRSFRSTPGARHERLEGDLAWILERLRAVGVPEVVAVDLGRPEFDVAVVRAVVPGLEGADDHDGYVPGPRARRLRGTCR